MIGWQETFYGWHAYECGHRLTVSKYRRGTGRGFGYVARLDGSASTSPAKPHRTPKAAMVEAEQMLVALAERSMSCR